MSRQQGDHGEIGFSDTHTDVDGRVVSELRIMVQTMVGLAERDGGTAPCH